MNKIFSLPEYGMPVFRQICGLIPPHLVKRLADKHGVTGKSRTFSPWSHIVSLLYGQMAHATGLNDICDALQMQGPMLQTIRGATPPCRNTFSHANQVRNPDMAKELFWCVYESLISQDGRFGKKKMRRGFLRRFRQTIYAVDSSTIQLVANNLDWAKHRRRKAAAKCNLLLNLQCRLPQCVIIDTAKHHDNTKAPALCADLKSGEIVVFDKAYVDFEHLWNLNQRGVFWVTRAKDNMQYRVLKRRETGNDSRVLSDQLIKLTGTKTSESYSQPLRRVVAMVMVDGKETEMAFITNNLQWSPWTVAELYRCRWEIEVFFKELKQSLQLCDFVGCNANAVKWQIWIGLLTHLLVRYLAHAQSWGHSFLRLFAILRASLWRRWHLGQLLEAYGIAKGIKPIRAAPEQAYLPGFGLSCGTARGPNC